MKNPLFILLAFLFAFLCSDCKKNSGSITSNVGTLYYCSRPLPSGSWQVYKKDLASGSINKVTDNTAYNYWWVEPSPNRTQLIMLRSPVSSSPNQFNYSDCEMIKSNADGTNQQIILADNANGWFAFGNPHWHPNGNRILMIAQPTNSTNPFFAATIDTNGTNPKLLTSQYTLDANWSPTGNKIVFIGIGATGAVPLNFEVFKADYNESVNEVSNIQQLTSDNTRDQDPCFSPDGSKIAFSASDASITYADIIVIDSAGINRSTLLHDNGIHGGPLNWGTDEKIYHHSIYLASTNFTISSINTKNNDYETLLSSPSNGYISPFFVSK